MTLRKRLSRFLGDRTVVAVPLLILILVGFVVAYQFVEPAPPHHITLASGQPGGAYRSFAGDYAKRLAKEGITVNIVETAGAVDNLKRLTNPDQKVDAAFVQSGIDNPNPSVALQSLGSLYYEPLWIFVRPEVVSGDGLKALANRRVAIGPLGSGTRALADRLLKAEGVTIEEVPAANAGEAVDALLAARADAIALVAAPTADVIGRLSKAAGVRLLALPEADALTSHFHDLSPLVLPAGVLDLKRNVPAMATPMVAATANLVVRADLHPALKELLVLTAFKIHGGASLLHDAGVFPSPDHLAFPLSSDARRIYSRGPSFLQRYLPFWAANLINRFLIMLLPLVTLALPLARVMPPVYRWRVRRRIYTWYRDLMAIEREVLEGKVDRDVALERLRLVERESGHVTVPLSYADELYNLRLHIQYLRGLVQDLEKQEG